MSTNDLTKKLKKLKHVQVYNTIFQLIQDGTYSPGMQLPSEPELARQLNVSRMTLRKSLALLQEDHLIKISEEREILYSRLLKLNITKVSNIFNTPYMQAYHLTSQRLSWNIGLKCPLLPLQHP